jgi:hypothetical protein
MFIPVDHANADTIKSSEWSSDRRSATHRMAVPAIKTNWLWIPLHAYATKRERRLISKIFPNLK